MDIEQLQNAFGEETPAGMYFKRPTDEVSRNIVLAADRRTRASLSVYGIAFDYDYRITTIATQMLTTICTELGSITKTLPLGDCACNNMYNILLIELSNKICRGEKEGNVNVSFHMGDVGHSVLRGEMVPSTERRTIDDDYMPESQEEKDFQLKLEQICRTACRHQNAISFGSWGSGNALICTGVTCEFMLNLYREIAISLITEMKENPNASECSKFVNFNNVVEIYGVVRRNEDGSDAGIEITFTPGVVAKIAVKSDEGTEVR